MMWAVTWSLCLPTAKSPETRHECVPLPGENPVRGDNTAGTGTTEELQNLSLTLEQAAWAAVCGRFVDLKGDQKMVEDEQSPWGSAYPPRRMQTTTQDLQGSHERRTATNRQGPSPGPCVGPQPRLRKHVTNVLHFLKSTRVRSDSPTGTSPDSNTSTRTTSTTHGSKRHIQGEVAHGTSSKM
ncbi:hypothetical protein C0Q70_06250 [Pomacea canaliculata]|uniref:Uncharacterized protein n=1 Tax=Pomacea canaliculata TaxID=400727 RepID=A0A2T7PNH2_POMCA|nr:hypothetical protein C0Q70_06250 [Pomacea canaliculata]